MKPHLLVLAAALIAAPVAAQDAPASATVQLAGADGASLGQAVLTEAPNGVLIRIEAKGLKPGWHGLHFHEIGNCTAPDFKSAGAHVHEKTTMVHGLLNPDANEAGDLPNLHVDPHGEGRAELFSTYVSLKSDKRIALVDADGSALVIHASPDDYRTQPIGGAGDRVACGVIK
jgi:superoxide dismutase, Cu-Zn family